MFWRSKEECLREAQSRVSGNSNLGQSRGCLFHYHVETGNERKTASHLNITLPNRYAAMKTQTLFEGRRPDRDSESQSDTTSDSDMYYMFSGQAHNVDETTTAEMDAFFSEVFGGNSRRYERAHWTSSKNFKVSDTASLPSAQLVCGGGQGQSDTQTVGSTTTTLKANSLNTLLSKGNVIHSLHYDSNDNLFLQLHGRKKFRLFSPSSMVRNFRFKGPILAEGAHSRQAVPRNSRS